jgi:hypothetical protein
MPAIDLNKQYDRVEERVKSLETYNQVTDATKQIISQQQSSLEKAEDSVSSPIDQLAEQKKRYQRQVSSQLEKLVDINKLLPDNRMSGKTTSSSVGLIKNQFTEALNTIISLIPEIITKEMMKQLGCSQEQTYDSSTASKGIYVPVSSVDLFGLLKVSPDTPLGKLSYETKGVQVQQNPFSMNRELYNRIQNEGVSYDDDNGKNYLGSSKQSLFNITYVKQDGFGNKGDFFQVQLINRDNNQNLVSQFMTDYFTTIKIVDLKNVFLQVFQILFGAISINVKMGAGEIEDQQYFQKILTRIMGLCFDDRAEIDVSGNAKVAPLDGVDDSFFELTDIDIRQIESELSNIQRGVVEYPDCTTVKLPVNTDDLFDTLNELLFIGDTDSAANTAVFNKAVDSVKKNRQWPQIDEIGLSIDGGIIKAIPNALYSAIISPKVLLPFMTMFKALEQIVVNGAGSAVDQVYDLKSYMKIFSKMNIEIMSQIGAEFVKILRNIIIRDIRKLLQKITADLKKNQLTKKYAIISQLIEAAILVSQFIDDYRRCKSVIDDILNIIEFALRGTNIQIPPFLLPLAALRTGFNNTRAMLEVIAQMQKLGIPTGPLPDGSPNLYLQSIKSQIEGVESERTQNSKMSALTPQQIVLPIGITIPMPMSGILL